MRNSEASVKKKNTTTINESADKLNKIFSRRKESLSTYSRKNSKNENGETAANFCWIDAFMVF